MVDKVIEAIKALPRYGYSQSKYDVMESSQGEYLTREAVLRIIKEHAPQLARVVIAEGVQVGPAGAENPECNFCGQRRRQVAKMFRNRESHICNECIALCVEIQGEEEQATRADGQVGGEEFRAGLPAEELRRAWAEWEAEHSRNIRFLTCGHRWEYEGIFQVFRLVDFPANKKLRPHGKTWAEVKQMAKDAAQPTKCRAGTDGDCYWSGCPQNRDKEPATSGRSCPLWESAEDR